MTHNAQLFISYQVATLNFLLVNKRFKNYFKLRMYYLLYITGHNVQVRYSQKNINM